MAAHPDFDVVIAGRAYDPALYVAYCIAQRSMAHGGRLYEQEVPALVLGGFYHMGKIMECGGLCATPKTSAARATIYEDGTFDIAPMDAVAARCTPLSVAAHTLYEKSRPDLLHGPGGYLDLTQTTYESLGDLFNSVCVRGGQFNITDSPSEPWTVKQEGARIAGFRTMLMGSFRDPILTAQLNDFLAVGKQKVSKHFASCTEEWSLDFHVYGPTAQPSESPGEIFIVGEALAPTQSLATSIASAARIYCIHSPYAGQVGTGGNFAFGLGGLNEIPAGPCCEFSVYHLLNLTPDERRARQVSEESDKVTSKENVSEGIFTWRAKIIARSTDTPPVSLYSTPSTRAITSTVKPTTSHTLAIDLSDSPTLRDIAKVIRSKNAGPYELTFDVIFDHEGVYHAVKESGLLSPTTMPALFGRAIENIVWCGFFDKALAFKVTFPRVRGGQLVSSGGFMENDVHGSQQYMPLLYLPLGAGLTAVLRTITV